MKKSLILTTATVLFTCMLQAQNLKGILKNAGSDSSQKTSVGKVLNGLSGKNGGALSTEEISGGLKEALIKGTEKGTQKLSAADGFFKDAVLKILMPEEAVKVEKTLRQFGMGRQVDDAILSMNRAAEDAAKQAAPIFINAIKEMSIQDAMGILKGGDKAATNYLQSKTTAALTAAFKPVIESSLKKTGATKHWNTVFTNYNRFSQEKVNTDLVAYVTERAMNGIFHMVAEEEMKIRKDPLARSSDLLKKVFSNQ